MWVIVGDSGQQHWVKEGVSLCGVPSDSVKVDINGKKCVSCLNRKS